MTHGACVWIALGTVYVLWGSTYLGIELVGETIPPLFGVGARFLAAASLMFAFTGVAIAVRRESIPREPRPSARPARRRTLSASPLLPSSQPG